MPEEIVRNPERGLRGFAVNKRRRNSFRVAPSKNEMRFPRVAKAQPWAGISQRFQRYSSFGLELANAFKVIHFLISLLPS